MSEVKKKKDPSKKDIEDQLEKVTKQCEESTKLVNYHTEIAKRCLGAMEVLQGLLGIDKEEEAK